MPPVSGSLQHPAEKPTIIIASGGTRVAPIKAALKGQLANGLITDENTAWLILGE
ncbi:sugar-binding domain-containing protein [Phyllobacterium sp. SB3]|uniref:sugar-binding domain-containing protein n=1 Tax=Phyllobacterium sp. SB3 TaxID=3156073 RepID=UPI0032AFE946